MSKYIRQQPSIYRNKDEYISEEAWLNRLEKNLNKSAVQSIEVSESYNDRIRSILDGKKSKFSSVDDVVKDMQRRSGLTSYLDEMSKVSKEETTNVKKASKLPELFMKHPEILNTVENIVKEYNGNLPVIAMIGRLQSIYNSEVRDVSMWDDPELLKFLSMMNLKKKSEQPERHQETNIGLLNHDKNDIDIENTDAFSGLNPVKM